MFLLTAAFRRTAIYVYATIATNKYRLSVALLMTSQKANSELDQAGQGFDVKIQCAWMHMLLWAEGWETQNAREVWGINPPGKISSSEALLRLF